MSSPNLIAPRWPSPRRYPKDLYQHYCERHHAKLAYVNSAMYNTTKRKREQISSRNTSPRSCQGYGHSGRPFSGYIRIGRRPSFSMGSQNELAWIDRDKFNQVLFNRVELSGMRHVCRRDIPYKWKQNISFPPFPLVFQPPPPPLEPQVSHRLLHLWFLRFISSLSTPHHQEQRGPMCRSVESGTYRGWHSRPA